LGDTPSGTMVCIWDSVSALEKEIEIGSNLVVGIENVELRFEAADENLIANGATLFSERN
jgi:hypothetical protein